jgi:glycine cleavage system H protein
MIVQEATMTIIGKYEFPDDLYYDTDHGWARAEGILVTMGMTQFAQDLAGEIVYVEAPRIGRQVARGEPFMSMESGKWVGRFKSLVSGKLVEANGELEWESTTVNQDPYGAGWLAKVEIAGPEALEGLLKANSPEFAAFIAEQRSKYNK